MKIKLDEEKLRYIALFEDTTGVTPRDCVKSEEKGCLTFVVSKDDMGKAIGQKGRNIRKMREEVGRKVEVVEYSDNPEEFLENIFSPVEVRSVKLEEEGEELVASVEVEETEKGRAVGRDGWNIKRARKLLDRHHGVSDVSLT